MPTTRPITAEDILGGGGVFDVIKAEQPTVSLPSEMATGFKRGLFTAAPEMIGGAIKAFSPVDSDAYGAGAELQESAKAIAQLPELQKSDTKRGIAGDVMVSGAEGLGQMAPVLAGSIINPVLGAGIAGGMYGGSTYQDTKERMLKQEGLDDAFAAANHDDARVQKAKATGLATGFVQGGGDAAMTYLGGRFLKGAFPNIGKQTAQGVMREIATPATSTLKRFGKAWGAEMLGEGITEAAQDEGQAAVERMAGLKDAPAFGAQALESAKGGVGMALLLGPLAGPGHYRTFRDAQQVQQVLADPSAAPEFRMNAAKVLGNEIAKVDPSAAINFMTHAQDAIGDKATTGSAPYALDLNNTALLEPFTPVTAPGSSSGERSSAPAGQAAPPVQPGATILQEAGTVGVNPLDSMDQIPDFVAPSRIPGPQLPNMPPLGALSRAIATVAPVAQDMALPEVRPVIPPVQQQGIAGPIIDAEFSPVYPALPAPPSDMEKARAWAQEQIQAGKSHLMQNRGISDEQHDARILKEYQKATTSQGGNNDLSAVRQKTGSSKNVSPVRGEAVAIAELKQAKQRILADPLSRGIAGGEVYTPQATKLIGEINTEIQRLSAPAAVPSVSAPAPKSEPVQIKTIKPKSPNAARPLDASKDSLLVAISKLGGISRSDINSHVVDSKGLAMGVNTISRRESRSFKGVIHDKGLPLDSMREALIEQGYLPEGADINTLLNRLDSSQRGVVHRSNQDSGAAAESEYDDGAARYQSMLEDMSDEEYDEFHRNQWLEEQSGALAYANDVLDELVGSFDGAEMTAADWQAVEDQFMEALNGEISDNAAASGTDDQREVQGYAAQRETGLPQPGQGVVTGEDQESGARGKGQGLSQSAIPTHVVNAVDNPRDVLQSVSLATKQQTKDTLNENLKNGGIPHSNPIRLTTVEELHDIINTGKLREGKDYEGRSGISAQLVDGKKPIVAYGPNDKISAAIIFPASSNVGKGQSTNEVKVDARTDVNALRFVVDGFKAVMGFDELREAVKDNKKGETQSDSQPRETAQEGGSLTAKDYLERSKNEAKEFLAALGLKPESRSPMGQYGKDFKGIKEYIDSYFKNTTNGTLTDNGYLSPHLTAAQKTKLVLAAEKAGLGVEVKQASKSVHKIVDGKTVSGYEDVPDKYVVVITPSAEKALDRSAEAAPISKPAKPKTDSDSAQAINKRSDDESELKALVALQRPGNTLFKRPKVSNYYIDSKNENDPDKDSHRLTPTRVKKLEAAGVLIHVGENRYALGKMPEAAPIDQAAHEAATSPNNETPEPTQAQIEAGNYKKGHVDFQGLDISIENPAGSKRKGVDPNGKAWETELHHHYGYIKGTIGKDKDHIDVFIGDNHDSGNVFVVDQIDPGTGTFDEHKVMLGFDTLESARSGYLKNYDKSGPQRIGGVTETSLEEFKQWLKDGDTRKRFEEPGTRSEVKPRTPNLEPASSAYGADNKLVSADRAAEIRARLKAKFDNQVNSGIDPEMLALGTELAIFHIEAGVRTFSAFAKAIAQDLGVPVHRLREYLRGWYNGARDTIEDKGLSIDGMDDSAVVREAHKALFEEKTTPEAQPPAHQRPSKHRKNLERMLANAKTEQGKANWRKRLDALKAKEAQAAKTVPENWHEQDNKIDATFQKGDRVQTSDGEHGEISNVSSYSTRAILIDYNGVRPDNTIRHSHMYTARMDNGVEKSLYRFQPETDPAPEVVPAPRFENKALDPQALLDQIKSDKDSAANKRAAASRAKKASVIKEHNDSAAVYAKKAVDKQAAFDAWALEYPAEAIKYQKTAEIVQVPSSSESTGSDQKPAGKLKMDIKETTHTKKGHKLFIVKMYDRVERDVYDKLNRDAKRTGNGWDKWSKGFQFLDRESAESFVEKWAGVKPEPVPVAKGPYVEYNAFMSDIYHTLEENGFLQESAKNTPDVFVESYKVAYNKAVTAKMVNHLNKGDNVKETYELALKNDLPELAARYLARVEKKKPVADDLTNNQQKTIRDLGPVGTKVQFTIGFNKAVFEIDGIEPVDGKVHVRGEKKDIYRWASEYKVTNHAESAIIEPENEGGGVSNDAPRDGGNGPSSVAGNKSGSVPGDETEQRPGERVRSGSASDQTRNGHPDARGKDDRSGSVGSKPTPVHLSDKEESSGSVQSVTAPPASEPRGLTLSGINPGNYRITPETQLGEGSRRTKILNNLAAIQLVKQLDAEKRYPTTDEQHVLARYVGWGGLKSVFDPTSKAALDQDTRNTLESILSREELFEARQSVLNAHYTSADIIGSIYSILDHMGFNGGNVLEPTYGSGNFIGLMPERQAAASKWYGSELDLVTAKIGQYLYPNAQLLQTGFQNAEFPYGKFDLVIGNPPFGGERITDTNKKRSEISGFKIHNYVIAKSGMHLRPGGVMAMVVTSRFMDTANSEARDYLAKHFKFLTAIRLPNDAFAKNAGTEVTTDLVFFQKLMPGESADDQYKGWLETGSTMTNTTGEEITLNKWFAKRPELMLGEPSMKGTMYGGRWKEGGQGEFTLNARPGQDTVAELQAIIQGELLARQKDIFKPTPAKSEAAAVSLQMNREDIGIGGYFEENGKLFMRQDDDEQGNPSFIELTADTPWTEKQSLGETRLNRIKGMLALREAAYELITAERHDLPGIESKRKALNSMYDGFVQKFGFISDNANASLMADDVKIESGLEVNYRKAISAAKAKTLGTRPQPAKAIKASILKQRVFFPSKEITSAANVRDGFNVSLSERGKLDLDYIASLTQKNREQVVDELAEAGLIFRDPESGEWLQEDLYLSGNVKAKLRQVDGREGYEKNAEALKRALPADVPSDEIFVDLGATWVPEQVYKDFAELLGIQNPRVMVIPETGSVKIVSHGSVTTNDMNVLLKNDDYGVAELFNAIANKQSVIAYDPGEERGSRVVNKERTKALAPIVKRLAATFRDWIMADPIRSSKLTQLYNDTQNTHAPRLYNGKHLKTVGNTPAIRLRNSQRNAAWRMIQSPVTLLDHVVGSGKTFTIVTGVMERKRLGLSNKPMIVVPNHLVGQWAADFLKLYPGARILAATKKDFEKANRRRLFARIATGNFDAVIVGHSSFGFIPVEPDTQREILMEEISYLERALHQAEQAEDKRTVRNIAERIAKKKEKITDLLSRPSDNVITFENMGIDNLVVDESHEFKNLEYSTAMQNITGMGSPKGAKKSFDLYAKIQYLRSKDGAVTFATGTPISNSLVEMYTILRYLNRPGLKDRKLDVFDSWAKMYALIEPTIEYTASQKLKERQVMNTFDNLPSMLQLYTEFADVISMKDLKRIYAEQIREMNKETGSNEREEFPVPNVVKGGRYLDVADPTQAQKEYMEYLVARADRLEKLGGQNDPKQDNHLWLMNDARKMALDIRLVDPLAPSDPNNKINRAAKNIKRIYDAWNDDKGAQMVFCDLSTPSKGADKSAAKFIKNALEVAGLDKDKRTQNLLSNLNFAEQWAMIRNRLETEMDRLNESADDSDSNDQRREKLDKFLSEISDDDTSLLFTADSGFSVYDDLKKTLVGMGIGESEIAFIHDANSQSQKDELFARVNSGDVRVLLGSSKKMGAGTNAQERLVALHHMDAPWRPSDVEQREGRIIRQGNVLYERDPDNFEVEIPAYSTRQTFDAVMWQILTRKAGMLDDFRSGTKRLTEEATDSASYAEFMAESTGNPIFREKFRLEKDIDELESSQRSISARRNASERIVRDADRMLADEQRTMDSRKRDLDEIKNATVFEVDGKKYNDDLTDAYNAALEKYRTDFREYETRLLPDFVAAKEAVDARQASGEIDEKEAKALTPKKPVQPSKPNLPRLEKTSQAAAAALRVSEMLDDVNDRGAVEFEFGGTQIVISKIPGMRDGEFDFTTSINGSKRWELSPSGLKHMSEGKLMSLFSTGAIKAEVASLYNYSVSSMQILNKNIADARLTLDKLKFADGPKLEAMRERYKAVVEEVNNLEKNMAEKREESNNRYMAGDRSRFGAAKFALGDRAAGTSAATAQAWAKTLPIAARVNIVQSVDDLPTNARAEIDKAGVNPNRVQAMELRGTIYVIADNVPDMRRIKALVIGHELAHAGQSKKIVDFAVDWFRRTKDGKSPQARAAHALLENVADRYGYDLENEKHFRLAVQEATAAYAEQAADGTLPTAGLMTRLFAYIKYWLRQNGLISHVSDSELSLAVSEMLRIGEKRLSTGMGGERAMFAALHGKKQSPIADRLSVISNKIVELEKQVDSAYENNDENADDLDAELAELKDTYESMFSEYESESSEYVDEVSLEEDLAQSYDAMVVRNLVGYTEQDAISNFRDALESRGADRVGAASDEKIMSIANDAYEYIKNRSKANARPHLAKFALQDQSIATHAAKIDAAAKVTTMTKQLFELAGQHLPQKLKAFAGKIASNPWFGSEGKPIRRMVVNLNIVRSHVRNQIISDLFTKSEGYEGVEGLHNLLKGASKAELKQFNDIIKYGDRNDVATTFTRDELYRGKTPFGKVSRPVVEAYKAFQQIIQASNRVRFEKLAEIALLPYKQETWFPELLDMLDMRMKLDSGLSSAQEIDQLAKLLSSTRKRMSDVELFGENNPTKKPVTEAVAEAYNRFMDKLETTSEPGLVRMAYKSITEYRGELDKIRNEWGQVKGYAPRLRKDGDWHVSVYRINEDGSRSKVYMKPTITEAGAQGEVAKIRKDIKGYLKGNYAEGEQYQVEYERNTATPSELLNDRGKELAIEQLIMTAFDNANVFKTSAEDLAAMKRAILDGVAKEIMAQGFSRHGISREKTLIEGYQDEDYVSVIKEYISGMAGWLAKMQYAVEVNREADRIADGNPDDKVWVHSYFKDSMRISNYMDEIAATARSVGAVYYLGFKISSALLNGFQNYTVGQAVLAGMMKKAGRKGEPIMMLAKAQRDMVMHATGKKKLSDEEMDVLRQAVRQGTAHAQTVRSMSGLNEQGFGSGWKKFVEIGMTPFSWVEQYVNREPGVLAAYRAFKTTPAGEFDQAAFTKAEEFTANAHFLMGSENLPELVRNLGAVGKALYLFQGYTHNYMLMMANALKNGEFNVIARSLGAIAALGGVFALPGADDLDKWILKWFGVSYKLKCKGWMRQHASEYGSLGEALEAFINYGAPSVAGIDMSRAISVNIPFVSDPNKTFGESMAGVWGGMAKKPVMAAQALGSGQYYRAVESMVPEFAANPMRAYRQATTGATTLSGKPILDETGHQMKYSGTDVAKKVMGFNPIDVAERTELKNVERGLGAAWNDERKDKLTALRVAKTQEEVRQAVQDVMKWNRKLFLSQAKGLVSPIKSESIQRARQFKTGSSDKKRMAWEKEFID